MMNFGTFNLNQGQPVSISGRRFATGNLLPDGKITFHAAAESEVVLLSEQEIAERYVAGTFEFIAVGDEGKDSKSSSFLVDFASHSDCHKKSARRKHLYVQAFARRAPQSCTRALGQTIVAKIAQELGDLNAPSCETVLTWSRWLRRASGDIRVFLPRIARRGNRRQRLAREVVELIRTNIEREYLTPQKRSVRSIHRFVETEIRRDNAFRGSEDQLEIPSYKALRRKILALDPYVVMLNREGRHAAERAFRAYGHGVPTTRPLERVEIDHTVLDLFAIDVKLALVLGRPYLTVAIDAHTRAVVGFHLGFTPPGYVTVMEVLKATILPKSDLRKRFPSIVNDWGCHGLPDMLVVDNGKEFHSLDLADACDQLKVQIQYCPPGEPWYKGKIERFFRTLNQRLIHELPGTTFGKSYKIAEYDPTKHAVVDFAVLQEVIHTWIVDVYMQDVHSGIKTSPADKWELSVSEFPPRWAPSMRDTEIVLGLIEERSIGRMGVEFRGLFFNCDELPHIKHRLPPKTKVKIKYLPDDLSHIYLRDPVTNKYIVVPAVDQAYAAGKSWWLHELIVAEAGRKVNGRVSRGDVLKAEARIKRKIESSIQKPNKRGNKHLARVVANAVGSPQGSTQSEPIPKVIGSDRANASKRSSPQPVETPRKAPPRPSSEKRPEDWTVDYD
jgi:putative transposase